MVEETRAYVQYNVQLSILAELAQHPEHALDNDPSTVFSNNFKRERGGGKIYMLP